jgi:O-antigen ligase
MELKIIKNPEKFIIGFIASIFLYVFSGPLITTGYLIIFAFICFVNRRYVNQQKPRYEFYALASFMIYCLLTSSHAIDTKHAIKHIVKAGFILLFLSVILKKMTFDPMTFKHREIIISMLIMLNILIIIEYLYFYPITLFLRKILFIDQNLKQPIDKVSFLVSLLVPTIYIGFYKNNILYYSLVALTTINYIINPVLAGTLSYFFATIAMFLCYYFGKKFVKLYFGGIIVYLYVSPLIFKFATSLEWVNQNLDNIPQSWVHRVMMWHKTTKMIKHHPLIGYGLNCSDKTNNLDYFRDNVFIQLHPHNIFLQLWLETGAIGVIIISIFLVILFRNILAIKDSKSQLASIGIISTLFIYGNFSYGLWQSWLLCSIAMAVIIHKIVFHEKYSN